MEPYYTIEDQCRKTALTIEEEGTLNYLIAMISLCVKDCKENPVDSETYESAWDFMESKQLKDLCEMLDIDYNKVVQKFADEVLV